LALILPCPYKGFMLAVLVLLALRLPKPSKGFVYPFLLHDQDIDLHSYSLYLFDRLQNLDVMDTSSNCMKYIVLILRLS
jgi:hypothetical protein